MKKIILLGIILILTQSLLAQTNQKEDVHFGVKAGIIYSNMDFPQGAKVLENTITANWQPGLTAGLIVIVPISKKFYFQPEYHFLQMGGEIKNENFVYKINYLSLPVLLRWNPHKKWSLLAGPQFDLLISASKDSKANRSSIEHSIEHRNIGITGGIDFKVTKGLYFGTSLTQGLNNIDLERETDNLEFKFRKAQLTATYLF